MEIQYDLLQGLTYELRGAVEGTVDGSAADSGDKQTAEGDPLTLRLPQLQVWEAGGEVVQPRGENQHQNGD